MGFCRRSSVCLSSVYPHDISKTDATSITELDIEMFHDMFWKLIYFCQKSRRSRSRVIKTLPVWVFALLWVLASDSFFLLLISVTPYLVTFLISITSVDRSPYNGWHRNNRSSSEENSCIKYNIGGTRGNSRIIQSSAVQFPVTRQSVLRSVRRTLLSVHLSCMQRIL